MKVSVRAIFGIVFLISLQSVAEEPWQSELTSRKWTLTCEMTSRSDLQSWGAQGKMYLFFGKNHSVSVTFRMDKKNGWFTGKPIDSLFADISGLVNSSGGVEPYSVSVDPVPNFLGQWSLKLYLGGATVTLSRMSSGAAVRFVGPLVRSVDAGYYALGACILE